MAKGGYVIIPLTLTDEELASLMLGGTVSVSDADLEKWKHLFLLGKPIYFSRSNVIYPAVFAGSNRIAGTGEFVSIRVIIDIYLPAKSEYKNIVGVEINFETKVMSLFI